MAYPDELLTEGEHVIVHKHPHWKMLIGPTIAFVIVVGGGAYLSTPVASFSWNTIGRIVLAVVVVVLVCWLTLTPLVRWRSTHFIVTTDRVMAREGVVHRTGIDIPMSRISSVRFRHGIVDRLFGCGTLLIESASEEPLDFDDIPRVEYVHSLLYREVNDNPHDDFDHAPYEEDPS